MYNNYRTDVSSIIIFWRYHLIMSYRVQFTISDQEYQELCQEAERLNYPNVAELCKSRALSGKKSYADLYREIIEKIDKLPAGETFRIRNLIENPPTLLGRWIADNVRNGTIKGVKRVEASAADADLYQKI